MSSKTTVFLGLILTLWVRESLVAYPSLFFSEEEMEFIQTLSEKSSYNTPASKETIKLSAIVYLNKKNWVLWINDKIILPKNENSIYGFQIREVTPFEVQFFSSSRIFTLRPSQNYSIQDDKVLDEMEN